MAEQKVVNKLRKAKRVDSPSAEGWKRESKRKEKCGRGAGGARERALRQTKLIVIKLVSAAWLRFFSRGRRTLANLLFEFINIAATGEQAMRALNIRRSAASEAPCTSSETRESERSRFAFDHFAGRTAFNETFSAETRRLTHARRGEIAFAA